ncbi:uncharacterized protein CC84DRAFT_497428 [Paraphaeosphaeria sporulosa]|uniref:Uncharacterized protein n=1 Tax=Paraphaeosphaeria sporulosa TaxID=1460663 RepID=A0A177CVT5_9PLEO|nr:uncharacterized protein CC84DRAFT_497428 [Paraphaeosphaeria sporulosa]OAG10907.1 hypothetical protein CC84DRAFT_497428 [Paraphaeosphaeria sporulosa]
MQTTRFEWWGRATLTLGVARSVLKNTHTRKAALAFVPSHSESKGSQRTIRAPKNSITLDTNLRLSFGGIQTVRCSVRLGVTSATEARSRRGPSTLPDVKFSLHQLHDHNLHFSTRGCEKRPLLLCLLSGSSTVILCPSLGCRSTQTRLS